MTYQILVKNRYKKPSSDYLVSVAKKHLKERGGVSGIVEIELVNQKKMQSINLKFRNIDKPTDVLSFPAAEFPAKEKLYGTIFLCCDIIKLNAQQSKKTFDQEFSFILRHGIDHLLGIHHD